MDKAGQAPFQARGEIDMASAATLRADLRRYAATTDGDLVVDGTELEFIDSSGISALLELHKELEGLSRRIVLINLATNCRRVFEVTGLLDLFSDGSRSPDRSNGQH